MHASVVISTLNRCRTLRLLLESLAQQRYGDFEVVVVNGPSTDGTVELLATWQDRVKVVECPVANLAVSRNIGIAAAAGEIIAFIDDDAIPDPCWLERMVSGYDSPEIGAVGGFVFDNSGVEFQTTYIVADRFGNTDTHYPKDPGLEFNKAGAPRYAAHLGTNTSVRRSLLISLNGFDEEFEYYLDETDLCVRIVDSGYIIKYAPTALVYHKFEASHLRNSSRILLNRYPIIKNQAYFAVKHGAPSAGLVPALQAIVAFVEHHRSQVDYLIQENLLPSTAIEDFDAEANRAVTVGIERAINRNAAASRITAHPQPFKPYLGRQIAPDHMTICVFAEADHCSMALRLAGGLAGIGHTVHLIAAHADEHTVTWQDSVWVHRVAIKCRSMPVIDTSPALWDRSESLFEEVRRIAENDPVDVVLTPTGGCLAAATLVNGRIPVVALIDEPVTPVYAAAGSEAGLGLRWLGEELAASFWWERRTALFADGLISPAPDARRQFERLYDITLDGRAVAELIDTASPRCWSAIAVYLQNIRQAGLAFRGPYPPIGEFSRRCTLADFWVTSPLFPWLAKVAAGSVDWRLWVHCLLIQHLANFEPEQALVIVCRELPWLYDFASRKRVRQKVTSDATLPSAVDELLGEAGRFDAVYCLVPLDPNGQAFSEIVSCLGLLCRPGGTLYLVAVGGNTDDRLATVRQRLAGAGLFASLDLTPLAVGNPEPAFADPEIEPYLHVEIDGTARPIAAVTLKLTPTSSRKLPQLLSDT